LKALPPQLGQFLPQLYASKVASIRQMLSPTAIRAVLLFFRGIGDRADSGLGLSSWSLKKD